VPWERVMSVGKRRGKMTAQLGFHEAVRAKQSCERKVGGGSAGQA
jgi:hypothetical protein